MTGLIIFVATVFTLCVVGAVYTVHRTKKNGRTDPASQAGYRSLDGDSLPGPFMAYHTLNAPFTVGAEKFDDFDEMRRNNDAVYRERD